MLILLNHADRVLDRLKDPRLLENVWNNLRQSDTQGHSTAAGVADIVDLHTVFPEESKDEDMKLLHFSCLKDRPYGKAWGVMRCYPLREPHTYSLKWVAVQPGLVMRASMLPC